MCSFYSYLLAARRLLTQRRKQRLETLLCLQHFRSAGTLVHKVLKGDGLVGRSTCLQTEGMQRMPLTLQQLDQIH